MLIINPGSTHDNLDAADYVAPADASGTIDNDPAVLS